MDYAYWPPTSAAVGLTAEAAGVAIGVATPDNERPSATKTEAPED